MKNKKHLVKGIVINIPAIVILGFALNSFIPTLINFVSYKLYGTEKNVAIITLILWGIAIFASLVEMHVGNALINNYFSESTNNNVTPSVHEWKCPKCGKIHSNYIAICDCGEHKPNKQ